MVLQRVTVPINIYYNFMGKRAIKKKNLNYLLNGVIMGWEKVKKLSSVLLKNKNASQFLSHFSNSGINSKSGCLFLNSMKCIF